MKPGAAVVRGLRRRAGATVSPFMKGKKKVIGRRIRRPLVEEAEAARPRRRPPVRGRCEAGAARARDTNAKLEPSVVKSPPRNRSQTCWRRRRAALLPLHQAEPPQSSSSAPPHLLRRRV
jgi:hypothetical protein